MQCARYALVLRPETHLENISICQMQDCRIREPNPLFTSGYPSHEKCSAELSIRNKPGRPTKPFALFLLSESLSLPLDFNAHV